MWQSLWGPHAKNKIRSMSQIKKKTPYIGVTGFMSSGEIKHVLDYTHLKGSNRLLMVGVLASSKSLEGLPNKWPGRYPKAQEIERIFINDDRCLNLVHYATKNPDTLEEQLVKITDIAGDHFNGFQLNMPFPNPKAIEHYLKRFPEKVIVFQVGGRAFELVNHSPYALAKRIVTEYDGLIDHVLLDPSGGTGQPFNPEVARGYLDQLAPHSAKFGLGVAGGLSSQSLHLIQPLVADYKDISIDAEGRLRESVNDQLDTGAAVDYVAGALDLFAGITAHS